MTDFGADTWAAVLVGLAPPPASYWIALCTTEPGSAIDGTDLADIEPDPAAAYARVELALGADGWAQSDPGFVVNSDDIFFPTPTGAGWGFVTHYALCTDASGGDVYAYGEFVNAIQLAGGLDVSLPPGTVVIQATSLSPSIVS